MLNFSNKKKVGELILQTKIIFFLDLQNNVNYVLEQLKV